MDVQRFSENKDIEEKNKKFILDLKSLEMESVKYLIKNYLRIRMLKVRDSFFKIVKDFSLKIQKYCDYIFKFDLLKFLSSNEEKFMKE